MSNWRKAEEFEGSNGIIFMRYPDGDIYWSDSGRVYLGDKPKGTTFMYMCDALQELKEADAIRTRATELEAALNDIQCLSPAAAYTSFDSKVIELDYSDYCDYCQKIKELTEVALKKKAGEK